VARRLSHLLDLYSIRQSVVAVAEPSRNPLSIGKGPDPGFLYTTIVSFSATPQCRVGGFKLRIEARSVMEMANRRASVPACRKRDTLPSPRKESNMSETTPVTETITIPGYRIEGVLGQGGMASVYLAIQESFEREVALKIMSPLLNSDPSFAARFKREARIVAQLSHASIVPVFDVGEYQSRHYLSMEYLPGGDLKRRILRGERDLNLALNVCTALCGALELAHRKGFVHRDIKPENILFRGDGTPVLTDFGIARALDSGRSMTVAGMLVGTPDYMSPEQVKGLELDGRSDLYSVGIVFFEILTGAVPFKADSTLSTALMHVSDPLPPLPPEYGAYQDFLDCLTAKEREERFASGAEVSRALRLIGTGRMTRNRSVTRGRSPREAYAAAEEAGLLAPANPTSPLPQANISQPTLARPHAAGENTTLKTLVPGLVEVPDTQAASTDRSFARAATASLQDGTAIRSGGAAGRSDATAARPGGVSSPPDVTAARSDGSAKPRNPAASRGASGGNAWRTRAKPDRTRQLLLGAAVLVVALVVVVSLYTIAGPDKDAGSPRPNGPGLAARTEAAVTSGSSGSQAAEEGTKASASDDQHAANGPAGNVASVAAPPETAVSATVADTTAPQSAASQTSPSTPVAKLATSSSAVGTPPGAAAGTQSQASPHSKRLSEKQRQRKEEEGRLIAQRAAELRATQLQAQEARIRELLSTAKSEYDTGALWQPAGASAADHYREILKMQPGRAEAVAGAQRVANVLAAEAEHSEAAGDIYTSRLLVEQIQSLQPDHEKLEGLKARLEQLVASPASLSSRDRGRFEKAAKYIARAEEDLGHQPLDYKTTTDAVEQYDKAVSAAALAPGLPSLKERLVTACAVAVRTELGNNDPKGALKLIGLAHKHNWASEDLDQLEASIQSGGASTAAIKEAGTR
jgi:serine/threonine protein kinase